MVIVYMCHDIMKHNKSSRSQIEEFGKQLGLPTEQIHSILNNTRHSNEYLSFSLGPPHYPAGYYGTVSINDFNIKKTNEKSNTKQNVEQ